MQRPNGFHNCSSSSPRVTTPTRRLHPKTPKGTIYPQHSVTKTPTSSSGGRRPRCSLSFPISYAAPVHQLMSWRTASAAYSDATPAAQRIVASAIALPSTPATARIGKFLPGGTLELGKMLADPPGSTRSDKLLRGRFNGDSEEQPKLYRRMAAAGMLDWTTSPRCVNSLFAVGKPAPPDAPPVQRIIFDGRKCNRLFRVPPNPHLPAPDDFAA